MSDDREAIAAFVIARSRDHAANVRAIPTNHKGWAADEFADLHAATRAFAAVWWRNFPWRAVGRAWLLRLAAPYSDHPDFDAGWGVG